MTRRRLRLRRASPGHRQPRPKASAGLVCVLAHGARAKSRSPRPCRRRRPCVGRHLAAACGGGAASGGAGRHAADRNRPRVAHRLSAVVGDPELPLDRTIAAAGAVGRAVADAGRGADPVVAAQARHRADDRELRRPDGDRPRYRGVSLCDLSQSALVRYSFEWPDEAWRGYYDDGYLSKFSRSGVTAVSDFINYGFMESDASATARLKVPLLDSCHPAARRPNIIMIHDESSFDIRQANGIKVPVGYGSHFKSFDGKTRKFLAESNGGPSWFTEYNVLAGLSSRSFG